MYKSVQEESIDDDVKEWKSSQLSVLPKVLKRYQCNRYYSMLMRLACATSVSPTRATYTREIHEVGMKSKQ